MVKRREYITDAEFTVVSPPTTPAANDWSGWGKLGPVERLVASALLFVVMAPLYYAVPRIVHYAFHRLFGW